MTAPQPGRPDDRAPREPAETIAFRPTGPAAPVPRGDETAVIPRPRGDETAVIPRPRGDETAVIPRPRSDQTVVIPKVAVPPRRVRAALARIPRPRQPEQVRRRAHARRPPRIVTLPVLGLAPQLLALSAAGVVLVAFAYAGARAGLGWAGAFYWAGQVVVYTPVVYRLLSPRLTGVAESFLLVMGLAVNQYMLKWMYSPDQFRFPDELQHWLSTTLVVETGRLFEPNSALPVAAHFPGLEEMGSAVVSLTGLSVTDAGLLVAGVLRLVFVGALFMMVRAGGGSPSLAGATCVIYATALHYLFFNAMYLYQTAALPFLMLAIWATRGWRRREPGFVPYAVVGVVSVVIVAVSHHITAMVMVGTLALLAGCDLVFPGRHPRRSTVVLAGTAAAVVAAWILLVATEVLGYLSAPVQSMFAALTQIFAGSGSKTSVAPGNPLWQLAIQALALLSLLVLLARACWVAVRKRERDAWQWAVLVGSVAFFATSGLRFMGAQGPELAGRASTFTYVPMSMLAAATIVEWRRSLRPRAWPEALRRWTVDTRWVQPAPLGAAMATLLMLAARAGGWPAYWGQLPGPYLVSGFERSVDGENVTAAWWTGEALGWHNRFATDLTGLTLVSTYGRQDPVGEAAQLYYDPVWGLRDQQILQSLQIGYLWVDVRMARQLPASGNYFLVDPQAQQHTTPLPVDKLDKFDHIPEVSRVYDSGNIRLYDVRGA
ncbi:hypothetical protein ACNTMW_19375 [Planosporangium sp. 12N6]|uniref:hypothetical protein n=1 Tax=Planosporangium spinosum TaxID=3402278 RepID=UPI003CF1EEF1